MITDPNAADIRARKIEKIRKCLRLSASSNPNEAAAALRQAQAMMRELGIEDPASLEIDSAQVITKEGFKGCVYLSRLVTMLMALLGVDAVISPGNGISRRRANVQYIGPESRVQIAVYIHKVLDRAVNKAWKSLRGDMKQRQGARQTFRLNFLVVVGEKLEKFRMTDDEKRGVELYKAAKYPALKEYKAKNALYDDEAGIMGIVAGREFDINIPINQNRLAIGASK